MHKCGFSGTLGQGLDMSQDEHKLYQTYMEIGDMHSKELQKKKQLSFGYNWMKKINKSKI